MPAPERKTEKQLQAQCDAWNAEHPEGTLVSFEEIVGKGETHRGKTVSEAQVMGGHSAVIWIEGKSGCVQLDHCTALPAQAEPAPEVNIAPNETLRLMIADLFESMGAPESEEQMQAALIAQADKLRATADACRATALYKGGRKKREEFKADLDKEVPAERRMLLAFLHLVERVDAAPLFIMALAASILILPVVADYLPAENQK